MLCRSNSPSNLPTAYTSYYKVVGTHPTNNNTQILVLIWGPAQSLTQIQFNTFYIMGEWTETDVQCLCMGF